MGSYHYLNIPEIRERFVHTDRGIHLRSYVFLGFPQDNDVSDFISEALGGDRHREIAQVGRLGIAFVYGFPSPEGKGVTRGLDLAIYRSKTLKEEPLTLEFQDNPIVHTWTLELPEKARKFKSLDRSQEGTLCMVESVILGRESERLLHALNRNKQTGKPFSPLRYLVNSANLPNIKEFE